MFYDGGNWSWYATGETSLITLKGLEHFGLSFMAWWGKLRCFPSSQTWSLMLYYACIVPLSFAASLIALVAWSLFFISFLMHCSARSLFDGGEVDGVNGGSYPRRIWLGNNPVIAFFLLLYIAVARAGHCVQSSGFADVTIWRYCSTH